MARIMGRKRLTARSRLTIVMLALFVGLSLLLVSINYVIVSRTTTDSIRIAATPGPSNGTSPAAPNFGTPEVSFLPGDVPEKIRRALEELQENPGEARTAELTALLSGEFARFLEEERAQARSDLLERLLVSSAIAVAIAAFLAWYVAGRVAKAAFSPVHRITGMARRLSGEQLHERIGLDGPDDELKELADTFDAMLGRLEKSFEARRSFSAYASHELRTPLASLRGEAELILADPESSSESVELALAAVATVDRTDRLVGSLLVISRAESGLDTSVVVDVAEIAGDVVGELVTIADQAHLDLHLDLGSGKVVGDAALLTSMIHNLLRNAIQYSHSAGTVILSVFTSRRGGNVMVVVENTGAELSEHDIETMSQPFHRLSRTSEQGTGHGLGTAIVGAVANVHGGTATWTRRDGGGVRVIVEIPAAPEARDRQARLLYGDHMS
jgi:signal transduction histidine kinase